MLAGAAALLFIATAAQAQRRQDDHRDRQDQRGQILPQVQHRPGDGSGGRAADAQRAEIEQARGGQLRAEEMQNQRRTAQDAEQQRQLQMRQREQAAELQRAQQIEERNRLIQAQQRAEVNRVYVRDRDYRPGYDYQYRIGGAYRETNQYGVDALRQAVNLGYQRGYRAGQLDLGDRVSPDYRRAFDYENGTYGYTPNYVPESDYSYYFREGFQRGYDDAYGSRMQYGTFSNGTASILATVLAGILGLTSIR
jgi:hypothetical protein